MGQQMQGRQRLTHHVVAVARSIPHPSESVGEALGMRTTEIGQVAPYQPYRPYRWMAA